MINAEMASTSSGRLTSCRRLRFSSVTKDVGVLTVFQLFSIYCGLGRKLFQLAVNKKVTD